MRRDIILIIILIFFSGNVLAFGVSTLYSDNYPLRLKPGEVKETFFLLRNVVEGDSDVSIKLELLTGQEIAQLLEGNKIYDLPYGSEIEVPVRISAPEDATIGANYKVGARFSPSAKSSTGQGNIDFIINIGKSIPVVIVDESGQTLEEREIFGLTLEDEEVVEKFAPRSRRTNNNILFSIIFILLASIIAALLLIIVLLLRRDKIVYYQQNYGYNRSNSGQESENYRYSQGSNI